MLSATLFLAFSLLVYFDGIAAFASTDESASLLLITALILELGAVIGAFAVLTPYLLDNKLIKNETYPTVIAVVSRFDFYWSGYEPMEQIWFPVFVDDRSKKALKITVDEKVEVGDRFLLASLPKTRITVIRKMIATP